MKMKELVYYLIIFLFTFTYFCFFKSDVYLVADDTIFHTSNIIVMAKSISLSNLIPDKIMPSLANNLGYGVNIFYPIFPHLIASYIYKIFSLFNMSIADTMKFIHFMVIYLSGILMYKYVKTAFKDRRQAIVSAIMYMSMPYMFADVFMRGAFNESFIFIYLPIIFLSLYYLFESNEYNKFYLWFTLGYSLFIYSHLVLAIYLTILLILFMLVYYRKLFSKEIICKLVKASILILVITSNFWVPLVEHYLLDNYYIFSLVYDGITSSIEVVNLLYYFFPLRLSYATSNPEYFLSFNILPVCLLLIIWSYILGYKDRIEVKHKKILKGLIIFIGVSLLFASSSLLWKFMPNILKNIQFSWRIAIFIAFASSIIGGYGLRLFKGKIQMIMLLIIIIISGISNYNYSSKLIYTKIDDIEFLRDSCCYLQWSYEYLPVDSKRGSGQLTSKGKELGIGALNNTRIISNEVPNLSFEAFDIDDSIIVEFPRIYYLGYKLEHEDGKEVEVYQNGYGLLEAVIDKDGIYYLEYIGTLADRITRVLSLATIVGCISLLVYNLIKRKKY